MKFSTCTFKLKGILMAVILRIPFILSMPLRQWVVASRRFEVKGRGHLQWSKYQLFFVDMSTVEWGDGMLPRNIRIPLPMDATSYAIRMQLSLPRF